MKPRHIPTRTCISCRTSDEKRDLLRVVRAPDGTISHDVKGKSSGRGAYVCSTEECINLAKKQKKFERSLKVSAVPAEVFAALLATSSSIVSIAATELKATSTGSDNSVVTNLKSGSAQVTSAD